MKKSILLLSALICLALLVSCGPAEKVYTAEDVAGVVSGWTGIPVTTLTEGESRRLLVTIGQFSIVRLERDTQLLIPSFDYCIPTKSCGDTQGVGSAESPCDIFSRIDFPMDAFFPGRNEPCIQPSESCTGCYRTTNT